MKRTKYDKLVEHQRKLFAAAVSFTAMVWRGGKWDGLKTLDEAKEKGLELARDPSNRDSRPAMLYGVTKDGTSVLAGTIDKHGRFADTVNRIK
jgi:hypothetical protein